MIPKVCSSHLGARELGNHRRQSARSGAARNFNLLFTVRAVHEHSRAACLNGEILITARAVELDVHSKGDGGLWAAAPGYWKGNRAGGGAALPTSVTSNADKVWVVYLQA